MAETTSKTDLNNFVMALGSNAPIAGFVTPELLTTEVEVVVFEGHEPSRCRFGSSWVFSSCCKGSSTFFSLGFRR